MDEPAEARGGRRTWGFAQVTQLRTDGRWDWKPGFLPVRVVLSAAGPPWAPPEFKDSLVFDEGGQEESVSVSFFPPTCVFGSWLPGPGGTAPLPSALCPRGSGSQGIWDSHSFAIFSLPRVAVVLLWLLEEASRQGQKAAVKVLGNAAAWISASRPTAASGSLGKLAVLCAQFWKRPEEGSHAGMSPSWLGRSSQEAQLCLPVRGFLALALLPFPLALGPAGLCLPHLAPGWMGWRELGSTDVLAASWQPPHTCFGHCCAALGAEDTWRALRGCH